MIKNDTITDYAMPLLKLEQLNRKIHDACLDKDYRTAEDLAVHIAVEARILQATLAIMQNKDNFKGRTL